MEEVYKAIKEQTLLDAKVQLTAIAYYHSELEKNNLQMNNEITSIQDKYDILYAPLY